MTVSTIFSALLATTDFVALDVGAAHWLPHHWRIYQNEFAYVLVEPDQDACAELRSLAATLPSGAERIRVVPAALSGSGGRRTLYRLNSPTGSSLLPPHLPEDDIATFYRYPKIDNPTNVFPVTEIPLDTVTLADVLKAESLPGFHMIKLDTQGTELEIVLGLGPALDDTVLIQLEAGDHEFYAGQPSLATTMAALNDRGFRLYDLQLARSEMPLRGSPDQLYSRHVFASGPQGDPAYVTRLHEVDAVFIRDPAAAVKKGDADGLRRIMTAMCVYRLFGDAYQLTGLGEMAGLWDGLAASRYRRDIRRAHQFLRSHLDAGYRLYWENIG